MISLALGLSDVAVKKEAIFFGSLAVIAYLIAQLLKDLEPAKRREIIGIAIIIFIFRAMPGVGAGASWWQIDVLGFDEAFFGTLRQIASILAIIGLFALRGWMTRRPITYLVVFLSIYNAVMMLPFHRDVSWTAPLDRGPSWIRSPNHRHYRYDGRFPAGPGGHGSHAGLDRTGSAN